MKEPVSVNKKLSSLICALTSYSYVNSFTCTLYYVRALRSTEIFNYNLLITEFITHGYRCCFVFGE